MRLGFIGLCVFVLLSCEGLLSKTAQPNAPEPGEADGGTIVLPPVDSGVVGVGLGCDTLRVLEARCGSCHGATTAPGVPVALNSLVALQAPSSIAGQTNLDRSLVRMRAGTMPPAGRLPDAELKVFDDWRDAGTPACGGATVVEPELRSPNQLPQDLLFQCAGAQQTSSPSRLRRIGKDEWREHFEVTGSVPSWRGNAPFEHPSSDRYTTYSSAETIDDETLELYLDDTMLGAAGPTVWQWVKRAPGQQLTCMETMAVPDDACINRFARTLLRRGALFREPRADEVARLVAQTRRLLGADAGSRTALLSELSSSVWLTTGALFRSELGSGGAGATGRLTSWELAQSVSMTLGHRLPGAPRVLMRAPTGLVEYTCCSGGPRDGYPVGLEGFGAAYGVAADDGTISDPTVLRQFIRASAGELASPDGGDVDRLDLGIEVEFSERKSHSRFFLSTRLRAFFREWLGYTAAYDVFKDQPARTSRYQRLSTEHPIYGGLMRSYRSHQGEDPFEEEPTMVRLLDNTIARVVVEDRDVLKRLLTTRDYYLRARAGTDIGGPFGYDGVVAPTQTGRWVTMPATERAGVLTHPAWLASHAGNFHDDPSIVNRGKWVRENLLCQFVPPLSDVQVNAMVGPSSANRSARQRLDDATSGAECQGCHKLMNPLGYPFEIYNHAGYLRAVDFGDAGVSGASVLSNMPDPALDGPVRDAIELTQKLANSNHVKRCFVRQAFRFTMGRDETLADACTLARMETAYDRQGSYLDLLEALVTSDTYQLRSNP